MVAQLAAETRLNTAKAAEGAANTNKTRSMRPQALKTATQKGGKWRQMRVYYISAAVQEEDADDVSNSEEDEEREGKAPTEQRISTGSRKSNESATTSDLQHPPVANYV